jgi:hypothetical protein
MKDRHEISVEGERVVVPTVDAACVSAFYATTNAERADTGTVFLWTVAAFTSLDRLWECDTKEEARAVLGEALLWALAVHFVFGSEGDRAIQCKWLKSHEWSSRPPDADIEIYKDALRELRAKVVRLVPVAARYCPLPAKNKPLASATSLMPLVGSMVHDRTRPHADLRTVCGYLKVSPRECFEQAIYNRREILAHTHKSFQKKGDLK